MMKIIYNETFRQLLIEYNLPHNLSFSVDFPQKVQNILDDKILITINGITLNSFGKLPKATQDWENQSIIEDNENHFHVEHYVSSGDNKSAFMLGVMTLITLANKFKNEKINGIRFWLSFQTPKLGQLFAKQNNLEVLNDEYYISDRLSFYTLRIGEEIIAIDPKENTFSALLTIDI